ncbi:hypothetical protein FVF75_11090 [Maritimibacter fusiformis]|uniref:Uncharacterized protein n=2 Tax=Maritimibacter fusiformis TaxID=2603819 RepID=A0A5D0RH93_9RHOB|nr:hypothetical protein FVF75_11090 [Maritimibacter fusiformis]
MPAEDFWVGTLGEILSSNEGAENFETDIFFILFPATAVKAEAGKRHYLAKQNITDEQFLQFKRVAALQAVCSLAYTQSPNDFARFHSICDVSSMSSQFVDDLQEHGLDCVSLVETCTHATLAQSTRRIPDWALQGSDVFGPIHAIEGSRRPLFEQANVSTNFLMDYFAQDEELLSCFETSPSDARDQFCMFLAKVERLQAFMKRKYRIV